MGHSVSLFFGSLTALRVVAAHAPSARIYALAPRPAFFALPMTEAVHDEIHAQLGTGDWPEQGPMLSTTDRALAQRASRGSALAYLETDYFGGVGRQNAVLWRDGALILQPAELASGTSRPVALRPINAVLRGLGVVAAQGSDEFDSVGLGAWRSNEAIEAEAVPVVAGL